MAHACVSVRRARPLLGTFVEISVCGDDQSRIDRALDAAFDAVAKVHDLMSFHQADSDVGRLNQGAATRPVSVHPWTFQVLQTALDLHDRTGGLFDITIAPILQDAGLLPRSRGPVELNYLSTSWPGLTPASRMFPTCGLVLSSGSREHPTSVPSTPFSPSVRQDVDGRHKAGHDAESAQRDLKRPLSGTSGSNPTGSAIALLADRRIRVRGGTTIDLGGIAKGFAVDRAADALKSHDIACGLVNAGGDLFAFGKHPRSVHIRDPRDPRRCLCRVDVADEAMASTGIGFDPFRSVRTSGSAIIDPRSLQPVDRIIGATVRAPSCMIADALTKIVTIDPTGAPPLLDHHDASAMMVLADGETRVTPNWKGAASLAA
jgi:thiamine biosynthesis lipoprotein